MQLRAFGLLDFFILAGLLCAGVAFWPFFHSHQPAQVVVFHNKNILARYPLSDVSTFTVQGSTGPLIIDICDNSARVIHSTCLHGLCVKTGSISQTGQQIICAPNHILIEIVASSESKIDGVTR